ncbi:MAG TPA: M23 family metallopeptidase [Ktedonobacteraceae bacterium]|nr:M23 family metallopeptidase [Ktedonobacteraceae bacterium]
MFPEPEREDLPLLSLYPVTDSLPAPSMPSVTESLRTPSSLTTVKLPTIIPAEKKRARRERSEESVAPQHRRKIIFPGVLLGGVLVIALVTLLASPLSSGQEGEAQSLGQSVVNWITNGQVDHYLTTSQQIDPPTATPALLTGEGYCGGTDLWGTCATAVTASGVMGTGQMQRPIIGSVITQAFAHPEYQTWCGCWRPHTGIDLAAPYGTPIMAADSGQVIWTGWDWSGLGWAVKINHGHYIATIYGHLSRFIVTVGQNVTKGQVIGYEGSTGASTGPHLHFMVMVNNIWVNPILYVQLP